MAEACVHNTPILVHVGFPKAGSTWLQRRVFDNAQAGLVSPWEKQSILALDHVRVVDTFIFDEQIESLRAAYNPGLAQAKAAGLTPVISHEHLLLDQIGGWYPIREGVRRIAQLFPQGKILVTIREQKAMMLSAYMEHLRRGHTTRLQRFLGCDAEDRLGYGGVCRKEALLFDKFIDHLHAVFTPDNVLVLPMETLGQPIFWQRLQQFCPTIPDNAAEHVDTSHERHHRKSDFVFLKWLNHLGQGRMVTRDRESPLRQAAYGLNLALNRVTPTALYRRQRQKLQQQIETFIGDYFAPSNARTAKLIDMDLQSLGYDVQSTTA